MSPKGKSPKMKSMISPGKSVKQSVSPSEEEKNKKKNMPLKKLKCSWHELKTAVTQSRQSFNSFKLSTYFTPDLVFNTHFNNQLIIVEKAAETMNQLLHNTSSKSETAPKPKAQCALFGSSETDSSGVLAKQLPTITPTPPPSEADCEDKETVCGRVRLNKRKSESVRSLEQKNTKKSKLREIFNKSNQSDDDDKQEKEYEVKCIKDYVKGHGKEHYHVEWKGYGSEDDTFEPVDHLLDCDEILARFLVLRIKERQKCKTLENIKALQLPIHENAKAPLFSSFLQVYGAQTDNMKKKAIMLLSQKNAKSKEDITNQIVKISLPKDMTLEKYQKFHALVSDQLLMYSVKHERDEQLAVLRSWERKINLICSDPAPITVENNVDLSLPPLNFKYINDYMAGEGIEIPSNPMIGCQCKDCFTCQGTCCPHEMESYFSYNKHRRLKVSLGTPIFECNKLCACSQDCANRVVQQGRRIPLVIYRTANGRGWGVKSSELIRKDSFVTEYVGEVISSDEAEQRGKRYDSQGCTYLFDLDYNQGDLNPYTVDAANCGNVSHFINHSCDPNLVVFNVWVNCLDPDLPKLALFAARDIKKGQELSFDYNSGSTRHEFAELIKNGLADEMCSPPKSINNNAPASPATPGPIRMSKKNRMNGTTTCLCGAANCRKYFF